MAEYENRLRAGGVCVPPREVPFVSVGGGLRPRNNCPHRINGLRHGEVVLYRVLWGATVPLVEPDRRPACHEHFRTGIYPKHFAGSCPPGVSGSRCAPPGCNMNPQGFIAAANMKLEGLPGGSTAVS
jgi:hypothetical protein